MSLNDRMRAAAEDLQLRLAKVDAMGNDTERDALLDLIADLKAFLEDESRVTIKPETDGYYAGLRQRMVEALNLDE